MDCDLQGDASESSGSVIKALSVQDPESFCAIIQCVPDVYDCFLAYGRRWHSSGHRLTVVAEKTHTQPCARSQSLKAINLNLTEIDAAQSGLSAFVGEAAALLPVFEISD